MILILRCQMGKLRKTRDRINDIRSESDRLEINRSTARHHCNAASNKHGIKIGTHRSLVIEPMIAARVFSEKYLYIEERENCTCI